MNKLHKEIFYEHLDPQVAQFLLDLAKQDLPPIYTLPVENARKLLDDLQASTVGTIPANIQDTVIPGGPTQEVSIRIVRPIKSASTEILPAIIYLHGGGWILGNKFTHDHLIREIANRVHAAVVFVNFTPSPEARYPIAIEQTYTVADYIAKHGIKLQLDKNRIAIAGDSVGGLMATLVALLAKERGGPKFIHQLLFYPVTDATFTQESYKEFETGFWLTTKTMEWMWNAYLPDSSQRNKPAVCPLQASIDELKGLPPALIITIENDILRDEGEAYARKLMEAGVFVTAVRALGTIHDFVVLAPLKDTGPTRGAIDLAVETLKKFLHT